VQVELKPNYEVDFFRLDMCEGPVQERVG
jgi:hypothetical protein